MYIFKGNNLNYNYLFLFNILTFFFKYNSRNINNKRFSDSIKKKMKSLLKATSQMELDQIFSELEKSEEDGIEGILLKS
jgi:hypothetical protein